MNMDLKTKKAFTLAEIAVVFVIIALIAVVGIKITKSGTNLVNKYMSYAAFTNLKDGIGELIADDTTLPAYGVAPTTETCPMVPDPSATCDDSGVTFTSLQVASADNSHNIPWATAISECTDKGAGWRLPTQKELCSMYKYRAYISAPMSLVYYWSATKYDASFAWGQNFGNGSQVNRVKSDSSTVRCVYTPEPSATCDDSGVTFASLTVAAVDTAPSAINTCSDTTWDSNLTANIYCANNHWAGAKYSCSLMGAGWHLPTSQELCSMYKYRAYIVAPMSAARYWSATEYLALAYRAWDQNFNIVGGQTYNLKNLANNVRCVRTPSISVTPATSSASIPYTTSASTTNGTFTVTGTGGSGTVTITNPTVPSGGSVTMSPTSFTIADGGTQTVTFSATSPASSASTTTFTFGFSASIAGGNTATHTHTQNRAAAPPTPDPSATCDDSGVTFASLTVAAVDTAPSAINTCSDTTWDSNLNMYCANNHWAGAKYSCSLMGAGWHLPTSQELCSMYKYRAYIVAPMSAAGYWSATEYNTHFAWYQYFANGNQSYGNKYGGYNVRCVRSL